MKFDTPFFQGKHNIGILCFLRVRNLTHTMIRLRGAWPKDGVGVNILTLILHELKDIFHYFPKKVYSVNVTVFTIIAIIVKI